MCFRNESRANELLNQESDDDQFESPEGENEDEYAPAVPQKPVVTVVEGEADEFELEDSDEDETPSPKIFVPFIPQVTVPQPDTVEDKPTKPVEATPVQQDSPSAFYPGLKLPEKHTAPSSNPFAALGAIHSTPETEKKSTSDFLNLFANSSFSEFAKAEDSAQEYINSELQRKVSKLAYINIFLLLSVDNLFFF
jgi:hypothetical protein